MSKPILLHKWVVVENVEVIFVIYTTYFEKVLS